MGTSALLGGAATRLAASSDAKAMATRRNDHLEGLEGVRVAVFPISRYARRTNKLCINLHIQRSAFSVQRLR
jgi:hypothetical protein